MSDEATEYGSAVALIGMAGRFPGAGSVAELWRGLREGRSGLRELTDEEMLAAGVDPGTLADPSFVRVGGPVADLDLFDAALFGFTPREAELMEPQHRLFLECSWEALEAAGYCPTDVPGQVGVFGGCGFPDYIAKNLQHVSGEAGAGLLLAVGNERDSLASLVSYKLGLRGPSVAVQTFCSTSLVAVHLACQSLLTYECDIALAGGAFTPLPQPSGYQFQPGSIMSPDGVVRSFDAAANGTVMGAGAGVVALKRMADALADGDLIHAVILGSATNNDGRSRAGYTAPGVDGQADVIDAAIGVAGVKPETIGYVECHATGTMLGDSIELAAMNRVFSRPPDTPTVLGSLKPSLGHLDRASGVTGLIRASLALRHELLPGTPHFDTPNPALATALDRFTVLTEDRAWPAGDHPRRAGVSSFGLGGTNAHVVLEQAPPREPSPGRDGPHLLLFSAADDDAIAALTARLRGYLDSPAAAALDLADIAYTLQVSRGGFALRRAVVCADRADAIAALDDSGRWIDAKTQRRNPRVRLVADDDAPESWLADLLAVATALHPGKESAAAAEATPDAVLAALTGALTALGARVPANPPSDAVEIVVAPEADESAAEWLLDRLARLWQAGAAIDWAALHGGRGRRVELPTYPFQRRRYWVEPSPDAAAARPVAGKVFDRSRWTYLPTWGPRPLPTAAAALDERLRDAGPWLVLAGDERGEAIAARLRRAAAAVTLVRAADRFGRDDDGELTVRPDSADDLAAVFAELPAGPRTIVHAFALAPIDPALTDPIARFDAAQRHGLTSALALSGRLVDDATDATRAELVLLTSGAVGVAGGDLTCPEHATLGALAPSLAQENPRLRSRHVDVCARPDVDLVLATAVCDYEGPAAVRATEAWLRRHEPWPTPDPAEQPAVADGAVVLITGGLGDVGLTLARHLASRHRCRLVLTVRSPLPPREEWDAYLAAVPPGGERTARHLTSLADLEARGAEVLAMSADVTDADAMRAVVAAAVERFGSIDVAVHAAGVQDGAYFTFAHLMEPWQVEGHLAAKVKGFLVLQDVLRGHCPDARITTSSIAAVLGGLTLAPYASANAALDAYCQVARAAGEGRWITVDWDTWHVDAARVDGHSEAVTDFAMSPAEAVDVFERALLAGDRVSRLVISTGSLDQRVAQWVVGDIHAGAGDGDERELHPRPDLGTPFVAPAPGSEETLAGLWSRVLGIEPIGALDNYFELGGHSLLAIELTTRVRRVMNASIPVTALLERPTVRDLAAFIDGAAAPTATDTTDAAQAGPAQATDGGEPRATD